MAYAGETAYITGWSSLVELKVKMLILSYRRRQRHRQVPGRETCQ